MEVLNGKDLYVAFDEAMDDYNEQVGAVLVRHLESTDRSYLIYVWRMASVNGDTVANLVNEQCCKRFPAKHFKLFLTDGAPYCVKARVKLSM